MDVAAQKGIVLRLFGGMAIRFHCPSATHSSLGRKYVDIDFMALRKQSRDIKKLFAELGYVPRDRFNALQGDKRLIFNDLENGRRVDIFLETFEMCHKFDFKDRLTLDTPTISLADLLATKLQVVEITEREYRDVMALVRDHELADSDKLETINVSYLAALCGNDWGIYKTFTVNIGNILNALPKYELDPESKAIVQRRLEEIRNRIENEPKSVRWRIRARVGDKAQWYELPEQDKEVIDSRVG